MMTVNEYGILRTESTADQLAQMQKRGAGTVTVWFCPFGNHNPEFVRNRAQFMEVFGSTLTDNLSKEFGVDIPWGLFSPELEQLTWSQMAHRFIGPVAQTPSPDPTPEIIVCTWSEWVLAHLTRFGDEPDHLDDGEWPMPTELAGR